MYQQLGNIPYWTASNMGPRTLLLGILEHLSKFKDETTKIDDFLAVLGKNFSLESLAVLNNLKLLYKTDLWTFTDFSWQYVCLSLECLLCLKRSLQDSEHESDRLLSVAQQRNVRALLDRIVSLALSPSLLPGVYPFTQPCSFQSSLTDFQSYERLCIVTLSLVSLYNDDTFHALVFPQFLTPALCALCQLTMVPLKKSTDTIARLQRERLMFQQHLDSLVARLYKPMVIKELMIIEGNKKCPKWLKRGVGRLLTQQLHAPSGVFAIVQAVRDAANCTAPTAHSHLESLAQVITASPDLAVICPQILELLDSSDSELVRVAVMCVKALHARDASSCNAHILQPMTEPLTCLPSTEKSITLCLQRLHKCFAIPASGFWCLPVTLLQPYVHILFLVHCKIHQSVSYLRKTIEDLLFCCLSKCDDSSVNSIFRCLVYGEKVPVVLLQENYSFEFGEDGGVKLVETKETERSLEEFGDALMIFLERKDHNGALGNKLFLALLEFASTSKEMNTIDAIEKHLVTIKLLAVLSENTTVQKSLSENPRPVVKFLKTLLDQFLSEEVIETEIISIALVVLGVILNDCVRLKKCCWEDFSILEEPLAQLRFTTKSSEIRMLAEESYEVILTQGRVKIEPSKSKSVNSENENFKKSSGTFEEALREACDPLLPVRGHAVMQLAKLLATGDKLARTKKDQILCIFQENLKEEDSYLYLSAVEGLAVAAAEFPDSVIVSLTEQLTRPNLKSETRLKVGEALVRVTRLLGELVPVYKIELLNAFLYGTRDKDFLVRASSLSNLGELCRVLGFRIGPVLAEVLMCARCVISSDPSVEVRRAAVMLVYLLIKGLHKDVLNTLQDVLVELYRSLKLLHSTDKDDVTRLHAQLALEELNSSVLAFLFPQPQLTKKIFVLDPPA